MARGINPLLVDGHENYYAFFGGIWNRFNAGTGQWERGYPEGQLQPVYYNYIESQYITYPVQYITEPNIDLTGETITVVKKDDVTLIIPQKSWWNRGRVWFKWEGGKWK